VIEGIWSTKPGLMLVRRRPDESVLESAPCPVAVPPPGYADLASPSLRRIGVMSDPDQASATFAEAAVLAEGAGAELVELPDADWHTAAATCRSEGLDLLVVGADPDGPLARLLSDPPDCPLLLCNHVFEPDEREYLLALTGLDA
jgi:hypothetical protein